MMQVIVYQLEVGRVAILTPAPGIGLTVLEVGQKDVPAGLPFWIVDADTIPEDREFRDAWELDVESMGAPSGIGGTYKPKQEQPE